MNENIYLLAGVGADERLFRYLDIKGTPVKWVVPSKDDSMIDYAKKLIPQIKGPDPILIGMSFGGMMAVELGKIMTVKKIILISSAVNETELPFTYRFAGRLKLHRILTGTLLKSSHRFMNWVMGAADPLRRELLADMLRDTDEKFLYWAIEKIVTWKNTVVPPNVIRIHGTNDRVLPLRKTDYTVEGGGHLMVANRAEEVSGYIKKILSVRSV